MRNYEEIFKDRRLQILTQVDDGDVIQIRAYYTHPVTQKRYWCKFTKAYGWEHLTISPQPQRGKVPEWDVMCRVKDIFWDEEECCIEYHPRKSQYVNNNETCLHIWRPLNVELPEPPTILLGVQGMSSEETSAITHQIVYQMSPEEARKLAEQIGIKTNRKMRRH